MKTYNRTEAIARMNALAEDNVPFLFIVDYAQEQSHVEPLDQINPATCLFQFPKAGNVGVAATAARYAGLIQWDITPPSPAAYKHSFDLVKQNLLAGNSYLTNLTCRVPVSTNLTMEEIFLHSEALYKLWLKDRFVCFSPEIFVRIEKGKIKSFPMKGTIDATLPNAEQLLMQDAKEAIAVETRSTVLNPTFIQERMKGGEGSAQMFGEIFRNIFGWHVMRPSAIDKELFNDLYRIYIKDENKLGIHEYFLRVNPAAFQAMTAVMLESARKGYWKASDEQLKTTASLHAQITREKGAACTEFVCDNTRLQSFVADRLNNSEKQTYTRNMQEVHEASVTNDKNVVLKEHKLASEQTVRKNRVNGVIAGTLVIIGFIGLVVLLKRRKKE